MTRRIVVFTDLDGTKYMTPEFNGSKTEYETFGSADSCDKDWEEIESEFESCKTLEDFRAANEKAQGYYHSSMGANPVLPVERVPVNGVPSTDYIIEVSADGPIDVTDNPEFREFFRHFCRQQMNAGKCEADSCEFCCIDSACNKIFNNEDEDEEDEYDD